MLTNIYIYEFGKPSAINLPWLGMGNIPACMVILEMVYSLYYILDINIYILIPNAPNNISEGVSTPKTMPTPV